MHSMHSMQSVHSTHSMQGVHSTQSMQICTVCTAYKLCTVCTVISGAVKSLPRPGRKQATATKLGIYSAYSPRSSIHSLTRCSKFCKPLKKIQNLVRLTRSPRHQWPSLRTKNGDLSIAFSVQGTGGRPMGPDPENRVGDQDTGSPGRPVSSGLKVPREQGYCRARTRPPYWPSRGVFPKYPLIAPAEMSNTPVWLFDPLEMTRMPSWHQKFEARIFQRIFALGIFGVGWAAMPPLLDCCFVSGS